MHVGQTMLAPLELECQLRVIDPEQMQDRRVRSVHDLDFDVPLLLNEADRAGRRADAAATLRTCRLVDCMLYAGEKQKWKSRTLTEQCRRRGIEFKAHDAVADAEATARLALAMVDEGLVESLEAAAEQQSGMWAAIVR